MVQCRYTSTFFVEILWNTMQNKLEINVLIDWQKIAFLKMYINLFKWNITFVFHQTTYRGILATRER